MLPYLTKDLSITYVQASFITTYFFFSYIVMQIPSGFLVDIFGPRILLTLGIFFAAIACIIFSCCNAVWIARSSRIVMGLFCAPAFVSVFYLIAKWFEPKRFALLVGFTETMGFAGTGIGMVILSSAVNSLGWRRAILLCGLAGLVIFSLILVFVRNEPENEDIVSNHLKDFSLKNELKNLGLMVTHSQVWINGVYIGLSFSVIPAFFSLWGIPFFEDKYNLSSTDAAGVVALGLVGAGIGGPFIGWFSDYLKKRKVIMVISSFLSAICVWLVIHLSPPLYIMFILNFLLGFFISGYVLAFAVIKEILPKKVKGKAMGFANTLCLLIGAPFLQPIIAHLMKEDANGPLPFTVALTPLAIAITLSFVLALFIKETHCEDFPEPYESQ